MRAKMTDYQILEKGILGEIKREIETVFNQLIKADIEKVANWETEGEEIELAFRYYSEPGKLVVRMNFTPFLNQPANRIFRELGWKTRNGGFEKIVKGR